MNTTMNVSLPEELKKRATESKYIIEGAIELRKRRKELEAKAATQAPKKDAPPALQ